MAQGVLSYKYEEEKTSTGMTSLAGLPVYLDLASVLGLGDHIRARMHVRESQGWTDEQMILSLVLLNLAGGDSVDDIRILDKDEGFCSNGGRRNDAGGRNSIAPFLPLPPCSGILKPSMILSKRRSAKGAKPSSLRRISTCPDSRG